VRLLLGTWQGLLLLLGTWQGLLLWERRRAPHTRRLVVTVPGE